MFQNKFLGRDGESLSSRMHGTDPWDDLRKESEALWRSIGESMASSQALVAGAITEEDAAAARSKAAGKLNEILGITRHFVK